VNWVEEKERFGKKECKKHKNGYRNILPPNIAAASIAYIISQYIEYIELFDSQNE